MTTDSPSLTRSLNLAAFERTLAEYPAITIHSDALASWRPCKRLAGSFPSFPSIGRAVALCTDGTVAWFTTSGAGLILCHTAAFHWSEPFGGKDRGTPPQPYSDAARSSGEPKVRKETDRKTAVRPTAAELAMSILKAA